MDTSVQTPQQVFFQPQHIAVPLFQRPYVWDEEEQWQPLWRDITRVAELKLSGLPNPAHFLGAIVLQSGEQQMGSVQTWNVVDGQQRLTTLQLLIDAIAAVFDELGQGPLARQLEDLTHNRSYAPDAEPDLKVRHANRDGDAYREVMTAEVPVDHDGLRNQRSRLVRAHAYFVGVVADWLGDDQSPDFGARAQALFVTVTQGLQLVVISLQANEDSQMIFETLNARGAPLTAADLIKNAVFQQLDRTEAGNGPSHAEIWPFDDPFWERTIRVGKAPISLASHFIAQWLASRVGEELSPREVFSRFRHHATYEAGVDMLTLMAGLRAQAQRFRGWLEAAATEDRHLDRTELAVYRMRELGVTSVHAVLLAVHDPEVGLPDAVRDRVIGAVESWVIRRILLGLATSGHGRVIAAIVKQIRTEPADGLDDRVSTLLSELDSASTYWPADEEVLTRLSTESVYRRFPHARLRILLEALEDRLRADYASPPVPRSGFPIEHLMPRKWETHWPVEGEAAETARAEHVHRLGNLTLLTSKLNSSVSNGAWSKKRVKLDAHDIFLLNRSVRASESWDEAAIDERTDRMLRLLLEVWPVPEGHEGRVADVTPQVAKNWVQPRHLIAAGMLDPGVELHPALASKADVRARVAADGWIEVGDRRFGSLSAAERHVSGSSVNGWLFWLLPDGRPVDVIRQAHMGTNPSRPSKGTSGFDWTPLHDLLQRLPTGRWTSYGDVADAAGTAPQPLGNHLANCAQCVGAWRVLKADGSVSGSFSWGDAERTDTPREMLEADGVRFVGGRAMPALRLDSAALGALMRGEDVEASTASVSSQEMGND